MRFFRKTKQKGRRNLDIRPRHPLAWCFLPFFFSSHTIYPIQSIIRLVICCIIDSMFFRTSLTKNHTLKFSFLAQAPCPSPVAPPRRKTGTRSPGRRRGLRWIRGSSRTEAPRTRPRPREAQPNGTSGPFGPPPHFSNMRALQRTSCTSRSSPRSTAGSSTTSTMPRRVHV